MSGKYYDGKKGHMPFGKVRLREPVTVESEIRDVWTMLRFWGRDRAISRKCASVPVTCRRRQERGSLLTASFYFGLPLKNRQTGQPKIRAVAMPPMNVKFQIIRRRFLNTNGYFG